MRYLPAADDCIPPPGKAFGEVMLAPFRCDDAWFGQLRHAFLLLRQADAFVPEVDGDPMVGGAHPPLVVDWRLAPAGPRELIDRFHRSIYAGRLARQVARGPVAPSHAYGPRIYLQGATLDWHADHAGSHEVGISICLDADLDDCWPLMFQCGSRIVSCCAGEGYGVVFRAVDLPHARPLALSGASQASMFFHFDASKGSGPARQEAPESGLDIAV